jgi:hypothetical protein
LAFGDCPVVREIGSITAAELPASYENGTVTVGRPRLAVVWTSNGDLVLVLTGLPGCSYDVQSTTTLADTNRWELLTTVTNAPGTIQIPISPLNPGASRFYRALAR